jgi:hypothetical protein
VQPSPEQLADWAGFAETIRDISEKLAALHPKWPRIAVGRKTKASWLLWPRPSSARMSARSSAEEIARLLGQAQAGKNIRLDWYYRRAQGGAAWLVTQGTVANHNFDLLAAPTLTALAHEHDVLVVATPGGRPVEAIPGPIPSDARLVSYLPFEWLLPKVDQLYSASKDRHISSVNDRFAVREVDGGEDSLAQFLQRGDANLAKGGAGELGQETLYEIEPGAVGGLES